MEQNFKKQIIEISNKGFPLNSYSKTIEQFLGTKPNIFSSGFQFPIMVLKDKALKHNIDRMARFCKSVGAELAPHVKTTMSPQIAQMQVDAGAFALTIANFWQAEIFRSFGFKKLIIANEVLDPTAIAATSTAGNVITDTNYVTHVFTAPGTFTITKVPAATANATLELLVVGGGGASMAPGNNPQGTAGAGAGGFIAGSNVATATTYTVIVGAGGNNGGAQNSSFIGGSGSANVNYIASGGGFGGGNFAISRSGGSGGGADGNGGSFGQGVAGQGFSGSPTQPGGGGGAGAASTTANGGVGRVAPMSPSLGTSYGTTGPSPGRWFAGGGSGSGGSGGAGGGGGPGQAGTTNTGGGAGAGAPGVGGSGIVIIRYPR